MKKITLIIAFLLIAGIAPGIFASSYVLPYPSYMPGNKLYSLSRFYDRVSAYWYWGDIGQIKYHSKLADKYIVEAKTLFEYSQYPLALDALTRSNAHITPLFGLIQSGQEHGKDMSGFTLLIGEMATKHMDLLTDLQADIPEKYSWQPERQAGGMLFLHEALRDAFTIRQEMMNRSI